MRSCSFFKTLFAFFIMCSLLVPSTLVDAASSKPLQVNITLSSEVAYVGETIYLKAFIPKKLGLYSDHWDGVDSYETYDAGDNYVSKAVILPTGKGYKPIRYQMDQKTTNGRTKYTGERKMNLLIVDHEMSKADVQIISVDSEVSLDNGGQVILIAKIPIEYAQRGGSGGWDGYLVETFYGPLSSDKKYSYSVAIFKPKLTGTYTIQYIPMLPDNWYGADSIDIKVVD